MSLRYYSAESAPPANKVQIPTFSILADMTDRQFNEAHSFLVSALNQNVDCYEIIISASTQIINDLSHFIKSVDVPVCLVELNDSDPWDTWNALSDHSRGEVEICIFDADIHLLPNFIETVASSLSVEGPLLLVLSVDIVGHPFSYSARFSNISDIRAAGPAWPIFVRRNIVTRFRSVITRDISDEFSATLGLVHTGDALEEVELMTLWLDGKLVAMLWLWLIELGDRINCRFWDLRGIAVWDVELHHVPREIFLHRFNQRRLMIYSWVTASLHVIDGHRLAVGSKGFLGSGSYLNASIHGEGSVLLCLPFMVASNLSLKLVNSLFEEGCSVYIATEFPHPESYQSDNGPWSQRVERHIPLHRYSSLEQFERIVSHIEIHNVKTLIIAGMPSAYVWLPKLKTMFPHLNVVDQIFNTVGHTRRCLSYETYIDQILVESDEMVRFMRGRGVVDQKIKKIPNGISLTHFSRDRFADGRIATLRRSFQFPKKVVRLVGYVGRMSPEKNPDGFLEIARLLLEEDPRVGIIIAGDGPMSEEVAQLAVRLKSDRVRVLGFMSDVAQLMCALDVLVVPSKLDGRPNSVMEAAGMGLPVVGSDVGGIPDMIEHGSTGYIFKSGDYKRAATYVLEILSTNIALASFRREARRLAVEKFGEQHMFDQYNRIFAPWL